MGAIECFYIIALNTVHALLQCAKMRLVMVLVWGSLVDIIYRR